MTGTAGRAEPALPSPAGVIVAGRAALPPQRGALLALLLVVLALTWPAPPSTAAVSDEEGELGVEVTAVGPPFLAPGQPLTVSGTLSNGTGSEARDVALELRLQRTPPASRFALNAWLDPDAAQRTLLLASEVIEEALPPGASRRFTFSLDADDLPLDSSPSAWGPRGILVAATAAGDSGRLADSDRTLLVWHPEDAGATATKVSVVVPLAPIAPELLGSALAGVSVPEQSGGRVAALAGATAAVPEIAWALDPALLDVEDTESDTPSVAGTTPAEGETPPEGLGRADPAELAAILHAGARGREILPLPYADADAAALVHGGQPGLYDDAAAAGRGILEAAGIVALDGIAWPAATEPDATTVTALASRGVTAVVLPQSVLPVARELAYTPTGRTTVVLGDDGTDEPETSLDALLWEESLSAALGGTAPRSSSKTEAAAALAARQYVLALTAMVSRERPSEPRHLLAAVPRTFDGDAEALGQRLGVLASAPWVELAPLSTLRSTPDPGLDRAELQAEVVEDAEVPRGLLQEVVDARLALDDFAVVAQDPERLVRGEHHRLLQVTSAAWRADPGGRSSFTNVVHKAAADLRREVAVLTSGTVNLISETGELPITVRNGLDQPISALLKLTPRQPSLQVPDVIPVEVPAGSEIPFPVDVTAVGSADVQVDAELTNSTGRRVGEPATLFVRVRADWENVGTALVAAAVLVTFVLGLVRSIRRARRRRALDAPQPGVPA